MPNRYQVNLDLSEEEFISFYYSMLVMRTNKQMPHASVCAKACDEIDEVYSGLRATIKEEAEIARGVMSHAAVVMPLIEAATRGKEIINEDASAMNNLLENTNDILNGNQ